MNAEIFSLLWESIKDTDANAVKEFDFDGNTYWGYSQSIPGEIQNDTDIRFAIFFLIPRQSTQSYNLLLRESISESNQRLTIGCFLLLSLVMGAVYIIIIFYSRRITVPVMKLTNYTHLMNQAQDREAKLYVVAQVKRDETFSHIADEFEAADFVQKHPNMLSRPESFKSHLSKADSTFTRDLDDDETGHRLLSGTKMSKIKARALLWNETSDEIDELKKIFFEFLKNLCEAKKGNFQN